MQPARCMVHRAERDSPRRTACIRQKAAPSDKMREFKGNGMGKRSPALSGYRAG
ncbi:hypothetical protein SAMN05216420_102344 [Nitrosospira sp. Nl5]|nr:hypothetical protein SAMN05216420_102344 [Nitrosospira sp. Nl5]